MWSNRQASKGMMDVLIWMKFGDVESQFHSNLIEFPKIPSLLCFYPLPIPHSEYLFRLPLLATPKTLKNNQPFTLVLGLLGILVKLLWGPT